MGNSHKGKLLDRIITGFSNKFNLQNFLRYFKIRDRLIISFLLISLVPVAIIGIYSSVHALRNMEERTRKYSLNITMQIFNNITYFLDNYINKFEQIALSNIIADDIANYNQVKYSEKVKIENRMWLTVSSVVGFDEGIDTVEIWSKQGEKFYFFSPISSGGISESSLIRETMEYDEIVWKVSRKEIASDHNIYIILTKAMKKSNGESAGATLMSINREYLDAVCQESVERTNSYVVLTDKNGMIISHPDQDKIMESYESEVLNRINILEKKRKDGSSVEKYFKIKIDNDLFLVSYDILPWNQWRVINVVPYNYLMNSTISQVKMILGVAFFIILFSIIFSYIVTRSINAPLNSILLMMQKVAKGDLNVKITAETKNAKDEYVILARGFNKMVSQLKKLINDVYMYELKKKKLESYKKEAELNGLQQQINPHFLYNTLESIYWSAQLEGDDEIGEIVTALGNYFRANINKGVEYITIEQEIENVNNYIFLQKIRFNERVNVNWDVEKEILELKTIKLILQPIIETIIIEGIECLEDRGVINIQVCKPNGQILFEVTGDGLDIFQKDLEQFDNYNDFFDSSIFINKSLKGIDNVNQRIKLYFDDKYGVKIIKKANQILAVDIILPVLNDKTLLE
ncbi:MAG: HAMP domain-containing protein [Firmicutes bacterium]|nr:HAMP domain-containing protein [Bacillota bacterium]